MKICPLCKQIHEKPGKYCSRSCANTRIFSIKSNETKSKRGKEWWNKLSEAEKIVHIEKLRLAVASRSSKIKSFEDTGFEGKRKIVIAEQKEKCFRCGINTWLSEPITLEIDHIDGNNQNHSRENMIAICPNCHSLTPTFRAKNKKTYVSDIDFIKALNSSITIREALIKLKMSPKGGNYKRANKFIINELAILGSTRNL